MPARLYGAMHSVEYSNSLANRLLNPPDKPVGVFPSDQLLKELRQLPAGATVGVEWFEELYRDGFCIGDSIEVDGATMKFKDSDVFYWDYVLRACGRYGLDVVFLDDYAALVEHCRLKLGEWARRTFLEEFQAELDSHRAAEAGRPGQFHMFPGFIQDEIKRSQNEAYRLSVEANFLHVVGREELMLGKMAAANLHAVVVGGAHASYFFTNRDSLRARGIDFESYATEVIEDLPLDGCVEATLIDDPEPDRYSLALREAAVRSHNALRFGRVLPERTPLFIGTWDTNIPPRGLFEMYLDQKPDAEGGFKGVIEDNLGSASFEGHIRGDGVMFTKSYGNAALELGGVPDPIVFKGKWENGRYIGRFSSGKASGNFWIAPFTAPSALS